MALSTCLLPASAAREGPHLATSPASNSTWAKVQSFADCVVNEGFSAHADAPGADSLPLRCPLREMESTAWGMWSHSGSAGGARTCCQAPAAGGQSTPSSLRTRVEPSVLDHPKQTCSMRPFLRAPPSLPPCLFHPGQSPFLSVTKHHKRVRFEQVLKLPT